jgi:hypothetical protein
MHGAATAGHEALISFGNPGNDHVEASAYLW